MNILGQMSPKFDQNSFSLAGQMQYVCVSIRTLTRQHKSILARKVGQTDLVLGLRSVFISRSVHVRLHVSVCSGYDLFHPG